MQFASRRPSVERKTPTPHPASHPHAHHVHHVLRADWHYHLLGIGGIGMSAIAEILHRRGIRVSGSDAMDGGPLRELEAAGIPVFAGHSGTVLENADAVVYSSAIGASHPIWEEVERRGLPRIHRAGMLRALAEGGKTLAITGTHGKTTTTAALGYAMIRQGADPTVLVGGKVPQLDGRNFRTGRGDWMVCEADESDASFLHLSPDAILLTNAEADHLDFHGSPENVRSAFREFLARLPPGGVLVYCGDDPHASALGAALGGAVGRSGAGRRVSYGSGEGSGGKPDPDARVRVNSITREGMRLEIAFRERVYPLDTPLVGRHNALNLCGAFVLACEIGMDAGNMLRALGEFRGVERRQQFIGQAGGLAIYDDYAHHPTEIRATLAGFRETRDDHLTVVFQPHLYSRTTYFAREFAEALAPAARIYVTDVHGAREAPVEGVSGALITAHLKGHPDAHYVPDWKAVAELARQGRIPEGILLTLGAGDITGLGPLLLSMLP